MNTFKMIDGDLYVVKSREGEKTYDHLISSQIEILSDTRNLQGEEWGRLLQWKDKDGITHRWYMPMEALVDSKVLLSTLLNGGLPYLSTAYDDRALLKEYIQTWPVKRTLRTTTKIGWNGRAFVLPDEVINGDETGEELVLTKDLRGYWKTAGETIQWKKHIGKLCSGNSRLLVAASIGFAGPLLRLAGMGSGGIHFYGLSSIGKTTLLRIAGSIAAGVQSWHATTNGLEAIAEAHNDATLCLDELSQADPDKVNDLAYLLGNGTGKTRMTKNLEAARTSSWRLMILSSGEETLASHSASAGKRAKGGVDMRLLPIEADAGASMGVFEDLHDFPTPDKLADEIKRRARLYHGTVFRDFLRHLTADQDRAMEVIREAQQSLSEHVPAGAVGEVKRAAAQLALLAAAGELASEFNLTGWQAGEATWGAIRCFADWLKNREADVPSDSARAIAQVRKFIGAHGMSRFCDDPSRVVYNLAGYKRPKGTDQIEYLILPETFKQEVCQGFGHNMVAKACEDAGFLRRQGKDWPVKTSPFPGMPQGRYFVVNSSILA